MSSINNLVRRNVRRNLLAASVSNANASTSIISRATGTSTRHFHISSTNHNSLSQPTSSSSSSSSRSDRLIKEGTERLIQVAQNIGLEQTPSATVTASIPIQPSPTATATTSPTFPLSTFSSTPTSLPTKEDPILSTFVNLLLKDGKRSLAIFHLTLCLSYISKSTNQPPLPLLTQAITLVSPLVRLSSRKQNGKQVQVPLALNGKQSTRRGIVAIIEASKKRSERELGNRLGREVLNVLEGNSTALQKKEEGAKMAVSNRANASVRI